MPAARHPSGTALELLAAQRQAGRAEGAPSLDARQDRLDRLGRALLASEDRIVAAISQDFGHRSETESRLYDVHSVVAGIRYLKSRLASWMRPSSRRPAAHFFPATARVEYQPLGVVGVISPWNYPVALALNPLSCALAAGNRALLKPSEKAPATSSVLADLIEQAFQPQEVAVVQGGEDVAREFAGLPFDHLVFTGSTAVGRSVLQAASHNLVPVTLELGGKSPTVVLRGANLRRAARRVAYGKLANAGQTCIAPDYLLLPCDNIEPFVAEYLRAIDEMYPEIARNPDYSAIANDQHFARLQRLLADAESKGARRVSVDCGAAAPLHRRFMAPALLLNVSDEMVAMREEIFGPILPLVPYDNIDDAISFIAARPRPLALYIFGRAGKERSRLLESTASGTVAINDTILQYAQDDLPFGGVGASGMGRYHGHEGFVNFSNVRPVFEQSAINLTSVARPPFGRLAAAMLKYLNR